MKCNWPENNIISNPITLKKTVHKCIYYRLRNLISISSTNYMLHKKNLSNLLSQKPIKPDQLKQLNHACFELFKICSKLQFDLFQSIHLTYLQIKDSETVSYSKPRIVLKQRIFYVFQRKLGKQDFSSEYSVLANSRPDILVDLHSD